MGATRMLQGTDADDLELETMLMAFVDDVRSQCSASEPLPRLRELAASLPAEHRARIRAIKRMYLDELRGVLNAGARSGTFDFADVRVTAFAIASPCGSAHPWFDPDGELTIDEVAAMYADFAAGMVRAPMRVE